MFKFIKNLFKKEETVEEIEEIDINQIEDWLNKHTSDIIEDIDKDINQAYENITLGIKDLKKSLDNLKNAELRNDKIALRAKQIMIGNRETYITRILMFVDDLDLENRGFFSGKRFYKEFDNKLEELNKQTIRGHYVMQEFLANESGKVAQDLKKITDNVNEIKDLIEKSPVYNLDEIHTTLKEFKDKQNVLKEINKKVESKREELEDYRFSREKVEKKITKLKKSEGYLEYKKLAEERDNLISDIKKLENEIESDFSVLERPLKKHSRLAMNEKLVSKYATSPILALLNDKDLEVSKILAKVKENIISNKIELKDKQKEKARNIHTN